VGFLGFKWKEGEVKLYSISAALSGSFVGVFTAPLIVVRTRMQSEILNNPCNHHYNEKYGRGPISIYNAIKYII